MIKRITILALLACCFIFSPSFRRGTGGGLAAQDVLWNVDFETRFENREGGDDLTPDQTLLYLRLNPELGVTLPADGRHRLMGGVAWYQPITDHGHGYKVLPAVYYHFAAEKTGLALGFVPRRLLLEQLPSYLMSDSLQYCTPVLRGLMVTNRGRRGWLQAVLDWRQMQSETRREAFVATVSGFVNLDARGRWSIGGHAQYNHLAKRKNAPEGECVNDDGTINPMLRWQALPGLRVQAGAIIQLQRARDEGKWYAPCGAVLSANFRHRWISIDEQLFAGKNIFPLYNRYGPELNLGDPYFCTKFYSRTDAYAVLFDRKCLDVRLGVTLHASQGRPFGWWQAIKVSYNIGGALYRKSSGQAAAHSTPLSDKL